MSPPPTLHEPQFVPAVLSNHGNLGSAPNGLVLTTRSENMRQALRQIARYAGYLRPVWLDGETGTGKDVLARHLHALSPRAQAPYLEASLGCLDDPMGGSDLFGHLQGAFTGAIRERRGLFQTAHRGTLFLNEMCKASRSIQAKLLRAIEQGVVVPVGSDRPIAVDVRLIVASSAPLYALVEDGSFLPDLLGRIECLRVWIPPLRDRAADIPVLVDAFLKRHAAECGYATPPRIHPELMQALCAAPWPRNVRQLGGTIFRLMVDAERSPVIGFEHCAGAHDDLRAPVRTRPLDVERVRQALTEAGTVTGAARSLGKSRGGLQTFCREHGVPTPGRRKPEPSLGHEVPEPRPTTV